MGVEPRRDEDELGSEGLQGGEHAPLEGRQPGVVTRPARERAVQRGALAVAEPALGGGAGPRVVGGLVEARVEHARVTLEEVLGPVPVVDVEVDDRHSLEAALVAGRPRGEGDVVGEAEPHGEPLLRVVSRRADRCERRVQVPGEDARGRLQDRGARGPRGQGRRGPAVGVRAVHEGRALEEGALHAHQVRRVVNRAQGRDGGRFRPTVQELFPLAALAQPLFHGGQALGALRVSRAPRVGSARGVGVEADPPHRSRRRKTDRR